MATGTPMRGMIQYSRFHTADIDEVVDLANATFAEPTEARAFKIMLDKKEARPYHPTWVARDGETLIGYAFGVPLPSDDGLYLSGTTLEIRQLAVVNAYRRAGIASELLRRVIVDARTRDFRHIVAKLTPQSAPFYEAAGWEVTNRGEGLAWVERAVDVRVPQKKRGPRTTTYTMWIETEDGYPQTARHPEDDGITFATPYGEEGPLQALAEAFDNRTAPAWLTGAVRSAIRQQARRVEPHT